MMQWWEPEEGSMWGVASVSNSEPQFAWGQPDWQQRRKPKVEAKLNPIRTSGTC